MTRVPKQTELTQVMVWLRHDVVQTKQLTTTPELVERADDTRRVGMS